MPEQALTIFRNGSALPAKAWDGVQLPSTRLDEGIGAGFARITYKGSKWGIKYQGETKLIPYQMPDGSVIPSPYLDIVILQAADHNSKAWYEGAYTEGQMGPPDCWSTNGIVPDPAAPKRQSKTCGGCDWNVWGSKVNRETGQATRGKACMDMKRLAVVPVGDILNEAYGGPMMLSVPPSSLKRLGPYQSKLKAAGVNYVQVWTRVTFLPGMAYPVFDFDAKAVLNEEQAQHVIQMMKHPLIERILNTELEQTEAWDESAEEVHRKIVPDKPVTMTQSAQDNLESPTHLRRPQPTDEPGSPQTGTPPLPQQPPPGVDPEQWKAFLAMQSGQQPVKRGRGRPPAQEGKRTPQVSPEPTDSEAVVAQQTKAAAAADGPVSMTGNEALSKLMDTINKTI